MNPPITNQLLCQLSYVGRESDCDSNSQNPPSESQRSPDGDRVGSGIGPQPEGVRNLDRGSAVAALCSVPSPARARLVALVAERSIPEPNTGCWLWLAHLNHEGYGKLWISATGNRVMAHRASYMAHVGTIPAGLQLDHLCRVRSCVNPAHLEPVTARENTARGDTIPAANAAKVDCDRGHPLSGDNLLVHKGHRRCRKCMALKSREHYERNREKVKARTRARELRLRRASLPYVVPDEVEG